MNGVYENSRNFRHDFELERYGINPSVLFRPSQRTQFRFSYERFHDERVVDRGIPSADGRPSPAHRSTFFGDPDNSNARATVNAGSAVVEHQAGLWSLRNTTTVGDYDKFYRNILPGSVSNDLALVTLSGYDNATVRRNVFNQTDATAILRTGRLRHTVLIGGEFGRQRSDNFRRTAFFDDATTIQVPFLYPNVRTSPLFRQSSSDADNRPVVNVGAAFVQDQIEISRHLQVVAGVRYDRFDMDFRNNRSGEQFGRVDDLVSPRLGLVVKPVEQLSIYGSYSVSYMPSSGEQFASLNATTQTLKPQKFSNYEFGAKMDLNRRLSITSAVYRLDTTNTTARDPNDAALLVQTGSQRTNGFEVGLNGNVTSRWLVSGGYAVQDAFISSPTTAASLGAKVALVPRHSLSLWNNYRLTSRWGVGLGLIHQAELFAAIDNRVTLPSFTRADGATFFEVTEKVRFQVNVENLFDTTYYPTAHNNNNILPGAARTLRSGLTVRF